MSWSSAVAEAERRIKKLPIPPEPTPLDGLEVTLINFESDSIAAGMVGGNSATFQAMTNRAAVKILKKRGARVNIVTMRMDNVLKWDGESKPPTLIDRLLFMAEVFNAVVLGHRENPKRNDELHTELQKLIKEGKSPL